MGSHTRHSPGYEPRRNCFERKQLDVFEVESANVGEMTKIRVGHDGAGWGAGWHLADVTVENLASGQILVFEANRWLDKKEGDGAIEVDLVPAVDDGSPKVSWKMVVTTANKSGAGTDADVFVELRGELGGYGPHTLLAQPGDFERSRSDSFSLSTPELGVLTQLTVGHNNKGVGAAWCLDRVDLQNMHTGDRYGFDFKSAWLDSKHGLSKSVAPSSFVPGTHTAMGSAPEGQANYTVDLATGSTQEGWLREGAVLVNIFGSGGQTGRQSLQMPASGFAPGRLESFALPTLSNTVSVNQVEIGHMGSRPWFVSHLVVANETSGARAKFLINRLLMPNQPQLVDASVPVPCDYRIEVQTSDIFGAGSGAHVSLNIFGSDGSTGGLQLVQTPPLPGTGGFSCSSSSCGPGGSAFRRNQLDVFVKKGLTDVGTPTQIELEHDSHGLGSGWHVSWVRVTNTTTGASGNFVINRWLAKGKEDGMTRRTVNAQDQSGLKFKALTGATGAAGYNVTFNTGNVISGGTSAAVWFEAIGQYGSSGTIRIPENRSAFARGTTFLTTYPDLPYLGELLQLRLGTSGQGMFASWNPLTMELMSSGLRPDLDSSALPAGDCSAASRNWPCVSLRYPCDGQRSRRRACSAGPGFSLFRRDVARNLRNTFPSGEGLGMPSPHVREDVQAWAGPDTVRVSVWDGNEGA
ncbi:MAG: hypothetical protein WDW38_002887 [Sanguina aurantia]